MPDVLARHPELSRATPEEKLQLIDQLWESVRRSREVPMPASHRGELERRVDAIQADKTLALSPQEARALLRR